MLLAKVLIPAAAVLAVGGYLKSRNGTEAIYRRTAVGAIEVKTLPAGTWLKTTADGNWHPQRNRLFGRLFRYIRSRQVKMTTPVEAAMEPAEMRFYVGTVDESRALPETEAVAVERVGARTVVAIGVRGSYTAERHRRALARLEEWLAEANDYEPDGDAYGVYWNSPFVPGPLKQSEVHIPVRAR